MKVSMDGLRRNISGDVERLRDITMDILQGEYWDEEDLADVVNDIITHSNVLNCIHNPDDPDFNDISDVEVNLIETVGATHD